MVRLMFALIVLLILHTLYEGVLSGHSKSTCSTAINRHSISYQKNDGQGYCISKSATQPYLEVVHATSDGLSSDVTSCILTNGTTHPYPYFASIITVVLCLALLIILFNFAPSLANSGQRRMR
jgi:hypothetical protein